MPAANGHDAIGAAIKEQPDLILMDVMMPGLDGWQATRLLKGDPKTANIPVGFVTARDRPEDVAAGFEAGGVLYVNNRATPNRLVARDRRGIYLNRLQDGRPRQNDGRGRPTAARQALIGTHGPRRP